MRTFISKVFLIMLVVTVFVTGSAIAVTDTTAPSISMSKASGSTIEAGIDIHMGQVEEAHMLLIEPGLLVIGQVHPLRLFLPVGQLR